MKLKFMGVQLLVVLLLGAVIYGYLNRTLAQCWTMEVTEQLINDAGLTRVAARRSGNCVVTLLYSTIYQIFALS